MHSFGHEQGRHESDGRAPLPPAAKPLRAWHYGVLALPFLGLLWPAFYARATPEIFGLPFFYAYQFGWIFLSAGLTAVVYRSILQRSNKR